MGEGGGGGEQDEDLLVPFPFTLLNKGTGFGATDMNSIVSIQDSSARIVHI